MMKEEDLVESIIFKLFFSLIFLVSVVVSTC